MFKWPAPNPRVLYIARGLAAALVCAGGVFVVARTLDGHYPLNEWLIWRLLPIWGYALLFNLSAVVFGAFLLRRLLGPRELPALERLLQSMMLGLTAFVLSLYLVGFVGLFQAWVALAIPGIFLIVGASEGRALLEELLAWRAALPVPKPLERVLGSLALLLGGAALLFLYLEALHVSAINYDATWYHFPIAQDYVREGRIVAFPGENHRAFPHLTSMVHTWALLVPKLPSSTQHWMLSLHLEYAIVLWRIVGAATLARHLLGGRDVRGLWVGFFLFPSIFVYDQSIGGSADHFLGFFAVPALLAAIRALPRFDWRWGALLGIALGGHVLVKYQGVYLFGAVTTLLALRWVFLAARGWLRARRGTLTPADVPLRSLAQGLGAIALAFLLVSSAHFVKNAVFYHNPVYPFAQNIFKSSYPKRQPGFYTETPIREAFAPKSSGVRRQLWAVGKMFDYSLETANRNLSKRRPYMGALFSMLLPCLLLLPRRRRYGVAVGVVTLAFVAWANSAANDRYLLSFHDLCIGLALALCVEVWELGWLARIGLVPLVGLQLVWGGDAMLYYGRKELEAGLDLIGQGYDGKYERFGNRETQRQITRAVPRDAVILSRNYKGLLGLERTVLSDIRAAQDYISYSHLKDPREFYDLLASRGVTHLMYPKGQRRPERWNNTVLFTDLFVRSAEKAKRYGGLVLGELPRRAPARSAPYLVLAAGIKGVPDGIWAVEQLDFDPRDRQRFSPRPSPRHGLTEVAQVFDQVQALILNRRKRGALSDEQLAAFELAESWDADELYLRKGRR